MPKQPRTEIASHPIVAQPTRGWKEIMAEHEAGNAQKPERAKQEPKPMRWNVEVEAPVKDEPKTAEKPRVIFKAKWLNPAEPQPAEVRGVVVESSPKPEKKSMQWKHKTDPDQAKAELERILSKGAPSSEPPVPAAVRRGRGAAKDEASSKGVRQ